MTLLRTGAIVFISLILAYWHSPATAQDRRQVTEPQPPTQICASLTPNQSRHIQRALDNCPAGGAVQLTAGYYPSTPLTIPSGVFLILEQDAVLAASTNPEDYDDGKGLCGQIDRHGHGCRPFILFDHAHNSGIYGTGVIDGQGGATMQDYSETWWQLARRAQKEGGKQNVPRLIEIDHARNITFAHITLRNAANFHVAMSYVTGATFWDLKIDTPADARNTDGIDPSASEDITIAHSFIRTGDDNVAIKAGHNGPSRHISILDNHFYWGHGMSIGSETVSGVSDVLVHDLTLDGTRWGLRIKSDRSRGGLVQNIHYDTICLRHNQWPIWFDTHYDHDAEGDDIPRYKAIYLQHIWGEDDGDLVIRGENTAHELDIHLNDIHFPSSSIWMIEHAHIAQQAPTLASNITKGSATPSTACESHWAIFPHRTKL